VQLSEKNSMFSHKISGLAYKQHVYRGGGERRWVVCVISPCPLWLQKTV